MIKFHSKTFDSAKKVMSFWVANKGGCKSNPSISYRKIGNSKEILLVFDKVDDVGDIFEIKKVFCVEKT